MRLPILLSLPLVLAACTPMPVRTPPADSEGAPASAPPARTAFIVVRHAEKADDDPQDPALDAGGHARAQALALALAQTPVAAIYATPFRRARQTATPTAEAKALPVLDYDPAQPASSLATVLHTRHAGDTVLVVGHSNTVPGIVAALCACPVAPLTEEDYGDLYRVRIDADGRASLERDRY